MGNGLPRYAHASACGGVGDGLPRYAHACLPRYAYAEGCLPYASACLHPTPLCVCVRVQCGHTLAAQGLLLAMTQGLLLALTNLAITNLAHLPLLLLLLLGLGLGLGLGLVSARSPPVAKVGR